MIGVFSIALVFLLPLLIWATSSCLPGQVPCGSTCCPSSDSCCVGPTGENGCALPGASVAPTAHMATAPSRHRSAALVFRAAPPASAPRWTAHAAPTRPPLLCGELRPEHRGVLPEVYQCLLQCQLELSDRPELLRGWHLRRLRRVQGLLLQSQTGNLLHHPEHAPGHLRSRIHVLL